MTYRIQKITPNGDAIALDLENEDWFARKKKTQFKQVRLNDVRDIYEKSEEIHLGSLQNISFQSLEEAEQLVKHSCQQFKIAGITTILEQGDGLNLSTKNLRELQDKLDEAKNNYNEF